jgi:predicted permease
MIRLFDAIRLDLRFAIRTLIRRPGFTATAVATLAIGIGGNTAIFSLVNGVLLSPLPYAEPEGLITVSVRAASPGGRPGSMSYPDIADIADQAPSIETLVGLSNMSATITELGDPFVLDVTRVTEGLLASFRVTPLMGRDIRADEFGADAPRVAVISRSMWQERFGARSDIVGRPLMINGFSYEIVGVAPAAFDFPAETQVWIPRQLDIEGCGRGCHTMTTVGRLTPGSTTDMARTETAAIASSLGSAYPDTNTEKTFLVRSLKEAVVGSVQQGLWILLAAVGLVLFIACANVVNLLLARASAREGETAVRTALGASSRRLVVQGIVESGVLATAGGIGGLLVALLGVDLLKSIAATTVPRVQQVTVDGTVLAVAAASVIVVTFIFGLAPIATARRTGALAQAGRSRADDRTTLRFRGALLAGEVALSAALLVGAGLLMSTFARLHAVDVGFETESILRFNIEAPSSRYPELAQVRTFFRTLEERIGSLPGVESVGSMFGAPLGRGRASGSARIRGRPEEGPLDEPEAYVRAVSPGLTATLGVPLVQGRMLRPADDQEGAEPVALINQEFARRYFANEDPIGQQVRLGVTFGWGPAQYRRIVGVVGDVRFDALTIEPQADMYIPHGQYGPEDLTVHVRTGGDPANLVRAIRQEVRTLDPDIPIHRIETIEDAVTRQVAPTRLYLVLVGAFAGAAALLAAVGLYGVVSYVVARRVREIGIRVALGANRSGIIKLVLSQGMRPALIGLALGLLGAFATARVLEAVLFGVSPRDPAIFIAAATLLMTVTATATAIPAIRASRLDPARILRTE